MKTSEFIRYAVDKYLSDKHLALCETPTRPADTIYLCVSLDKAREDLGKKQDHQYYKAEQLIASILRDTGCVLNSSLFVVGHSAGYWEDRRECSEELQEIGFMLAEFMALYFEDQGD